MAATNGYDPASVDLEPIHDQAQWLELELRVLLGEVALARLELEATDRQGAWPAAEPARANLPLPA